MTLGRCPTCGSHVFLTPGPCPHCGARSLVAAVLALGLVGCPLVEKAEPPYGVPTNDTADADTDTDTDTDTDADTDADSDTDDTGNR